MLIVQLVISFTAKLSVNSSFIITAIKNNFVKIKNTTTAEVISKTARI